MDQFTKHLIELSDSLDRNNNPKCANIVDDLIKRKSVTKIAQYVGVIGYVLKQNRAMGNCIRKKRVVNSGSMQDVVLDCLKEYQDGQSYDNNEWTKKYAQVIEKYPDNFSSSHVDYLEVIASENNINDHINSVRKTAALLKENGVDDELFNAVIKDLDSLDKWEDDVGHPPFKVAAPQSPRSRWSRFFSPSWTRRGKDKDTQFEMKSILERISNIAIQGKQAKNYINSLKQMAPYLEDKNTQRAIGQLSENNWQQINYINNFLIEKLKTDPNLYQAQDSIHGLDQSVSSIGRGMKDIQRTMRDLRLRDAVQGVSNQYAKLEMALGRLASNPLDEQALYYSQTMHGQLEQALNNDLSTEDSGFSEWIKAPPTTQEISPATTSPVPTAEPSSTGSPEPTLTGNSVQDTASQIRSLLGDESVKMLVDALNAVSFGDYGGDKLTPEQVLNANNLVEALRGAPVSSAPPTISPIRLAPESANLQRMIRMADVVDTISPELADLIDEYISKELKNNSELPIYQKMPQF